MGAVATVVLGPDSAVKINGTLFGVTKGTVDIRAKEQECGDTNDGYYEKHKGGRQVMEVNADFYNKFNVPLHSGPFALVPGTYITIEVYARGVGVQDPYKSDVFQLYQYRLDDDIDGKVAGHLQGKSSGSFLIPAN